MGEDLQKVEPTLPTYPLWMRLTVFLGSLCETLSDLQMAVRGDVNGSRGLLERMTTMEGDMKTTKSDVREVLNTLRMVYGMDKDEMTQGFDENNHPNRRAGDHKVMSPVAVDILRLVSVAVLVWLLTDVFPRIFSVTVH